METNSKILLFAGISVFTHTVIFMFFSNLLTNDRQLTVSSFSNYPSLQISLDSPAEKGLVESDNLSDQVARSPVKLAVPKKPAIKNLTAEKSAQLGITLREKPIELALPESTPVQSTPINETMADDRSIETLKPATIRPLLPESSNTLTRNTMILEKLNALVRENFNYPGFAVKRGWQGTVKLGLRIEANGTLSNVRIVKTSGYSILDQAALDTLSRTEHVNGIESWLAGNHFDTTLPVIYQLIDG